MEKRVAPVLSLLCLQVLVLASEVLSATFTFSNNCKHTVWPGLLSGAGTSPLSSTGFSLAKGETRSVSAPTGWSGRFWARTGCSADSTGKFTCETGDCGSGTVECSGAGAKPPSTLAEFTVDGSDRMDFYDVSLVDGFNLPVLVVPQVGASGVGNTTCVATGCVVELNGVCPSELKVVAASSGEGVACRSACDAFRSPEYCCEGSYGNSNTCQPTSYSQFFKHACPRAYSYAFDDRTSTFTCPGGTSYHIAFCPTTAMLKSAADGNLQPQTVSIPHAVQIGGSGINTAMIYQGALVASRAASSHASPLATAATLAVPFLWLLL